MATIAFLIYFCTIGLMHEGLFQALGDSRNVYLSTQLSFEQSNALIGTRQQILENFGEEQIKELPWVHHLTRSFLGTKSAEQLKDLHDRLVKVWPELKHYHVAFHKLGRFRSFVNNRPIIFLEPSEQVNKERLLKFRQALRMDEWSPKISIDDFSPHITLAQLAESTEDQLVEAFLAENPHLAHEIYPSLDTLYFQGKHDKTKISVQIVQS